MSGHKDIWTDEEWKELMKLQAEAFKSKFEGDHDERETEIRRTEGEGDNGAIQKG